MLKRFHIDSPPVALMAEQPPLGRQGGHLKRRWNHILRLPALHLLQWLLENERPNAVTLFGFLIRTDLNHQKS